MRSIRIFCRVLLLSAALVLYAFGKKIPVSPPGTAAFSGIVEEGIAGWYGYPHHGHPTASGEIYDMEKLTAAHRTLPFGTQVRVENSRNHKSVDVRINDRGPWSRGRIIDLSRAAAQKLDMIGTGIAHVRLQVLSLHDSAVADHHAVQVGAFQNRRRAERLRRRMERQCPEPCWVNENRIVPWCVYVLRPFP
jgi:rare lipoprotein A